MNTIQQQLIDLSIITSDFVRVIHPRVRDRGDIKVLKCEKSGVIYLSKSEHMDMSHYEEMDSFKYWSVDDRKAAVSSGVEDLERRSAFLKKIIPNKKWLDIGSGSGGILDCLGAYAKSVCAVEPQRGARECLEKEGYLVYQSISEVPEESYGIVTSFHVFEHVIDPLGHLHEIFSKMEPGGRLVIEVPHARDLLLTFLEHEAFKSFTFWSEHLILHTRNSLMQFLSSSGFVNVTVLGVQRYPLANHLHWLSKNKPGGHILFSSLRSSGLDGEYEKLLSSLDYTDTLIATAFKPN